MAVRVGETRSTVELALPLARLGDAPRPGDRWGLQLCRNVPSPSTWSAMFEFFGFRWPEHFGAVTFR